MLSPRPSACAAPSIWKEVETPQTKAGFCGCAITCFLHDLGSLPFMRRKHSYRLPTVQLIRPADVDRGQSDCSDVVARLDRGTRYDRDAGAPRQGGGLDPPPVRGMTGGHQRRL